MMRFNICQPFVHQVSSIISAIFVVLRFLPQQFFTIILWNGTCSDLWLFETINELGSKRHRTDVVGHFLRLILPSWSAAHRFPVVIILRLRKYPSTMLLMKFALRLLLLGTFLQEDLLLPDRVIQYLRGVHQARKLCMKQEL